MSDNPDSIRVAQKLMEQQGEIIRLRDRAEAAERRLAEIWAVLSDDAPESFDRLAAIGDIVRGKPSPPAERTDLERIHAEAGEADE